MNAQGPWSVRTTTRYTTADGDAGKTVELSIHHLHAGALEGAAIAILTDGPDAHDIANLIASAPDGLALARRVVEYFGDDEIPPQLDADLELRDMARALIARASAEGAQAPRAPGASAAPAEAPAAPGAQA